MAKKVGKLPLCKLEKQMQKLTEKDKLSIIGGKTIYMDQDGIIVGSTEDHPGWTYINIVESVYGIGYNKFKVLNSWYTQREINSNGGLGFYSFTGNGVTNELFEFLTQNTNVEWGLHESDDKYSVIETTHGSSSIYPGYYQGYQGFYHNHQYSSNPSKSDYQSKEIFAGYGYEYFGIYYEKDGKYYYY